MGISKKDRVILINQYRILAKIYPDEIEHYTELIEILENGYSIFYSQVEESILSDMNAEEGRFVLDVLDMYRAIETSKRKYGLTAFKSEYFSFFRGFDGTHETRYMSFSRFLINTQGKFAEQKLYLKENDNLNSHSATLETYGAMLAHWELLGKPRILSQEDALSIIKAKRG